MLCVYFLTLLGLAGLAGMGGFSFFVAVIVVSKSLSGELRKKKSHLNSQPTLNVDVYNILTINAPIATKVVGFSRLLKCLRSLYGNQCGPRSDCSYRSSLFWVHPVCFYTYFVSNVSPMLIQVLVGGADKKEVLNKQAANILNVDVYNILTINAPIATKVVGFSRLLKCLRSLYGNQYGPTLFASILILSVMLVQCLSKSLSGELTKKKS